MRLKVQAAVAAILIVIGGIPIVAALQAFSQLFREAGRKPVILAVGIIELAFSLPFFCGVVLAIVTLCQLVFRRK